MLLGLFFVIFGLCLCLLSPESEEKEEKNFSVYSFCMSAYTTFFFFSLFLFPNEISINTVEFGWDFWLFVSPY